MFELIFDPSVAKKIDKRTAKNVSLDKKVEKIINQLGSDPHHPGLKTHKASSKVKNPAWASWVNGEFRIIWDYGTGNTIHILDFGTHKEVYL